ncbi:MAG: hypothetical protein ABIM30_00270 [candidate division WOR-3 bacterium]
MIDLIISPNVMSEIWYLTNKCDNEIGGLLGFEFVGKNKLYCGRILTIPKGRYNSSYFEIDENALAEAMLNLIEKGNAFFVNGWWHSHVNMGVFLSQTDEETNRLILRNSRFVIPIVVNKHNNIFASVIFNNNIRITDVNLSMGRA